MFMNTAGTLSEQPSGLILRITPTIGFVQPYSISGSAQADSRFLPIGFSPGKTYSARSSVIIMDMGRESSILPFSGHTTS